MRFSNYIIESSFKSFGDSGDNFIYKNPRSRNIELEDAIDIAKKNCKEILKLYNKSDDRLYRGTTGGRYKLTDPGSSGERISAYAAHNYYTMLMNNLPAWKGYPKRAIVGTTGSGKAAFYENVYVMLPFDGAKIGICPGMDIFSNFGHAGRFNEFIHDIAYDFWYKGVDKSYSKLEKFLKSVTLEDFKKAQHGKMFSNTYDFEALWEQVKSKNMFDFLNDHYMNPKKEEFKCIKVSQLSPASWPINQEIWTDSKCLLVKFDYMHDFLAELEKQGGNK